MTLSADRIDALFTHLGIERAHVAGCMSGDWGEFAMRYADRIQSLTIVAPHLNNGTPDDVASFPPPVMVIAGDQGTPGERARGLAASFGDATLVELAGYESPAWADTTVDRGAEVEAALYVFLGGAERAADLPAISLPQGDGEHDGIHYRIRGSGPPLVLLPLSMAPSQWEPLIPSLSQRYCTITLGGAHLGVVSLLEARANAGYGDLVRQQVSRAAPAPGEVMLEIGCGSGALSRAVARHTDGRNPIVAADVNRYLLSEGRVLAAAEGLGDVVTFEEADAEALPYPDGRFDVALSSTVLEEGNADRMLAELARVTRPGGRVVAINRALDMTWWANLDLAADLKARVEALGPRTGSGVGETGCADAGLYARVLKAGLTPVVMGPQFAIYAEGARLDEVLPRLFAPLPEADAQTCRDAVRRASDRGTLFVAEPFHCAVCIKQA